MQFADDDESAVINEVAHALQVALLLATRVRQSLRAQADDAVELEAAVVLASKALRRLSPDGIMDEIDDDGEPL